MNIPKMDAMRHARFGLIDDGKGSMLAKVYVKTDEKQSMGSNEPIEGFCRPFPYLINSNEETFAVEPEIESGDVKSLSDELIEYISGLYESAHEGDWVESVIDFEIEQLSSVEQEIAKSLFEFTTRERPACLWNELYQTAHRTKKEKQTGVLLGPDTLNDVEGNERYNFSYLPSINNVDDWSLSHYSSEIEYDSGDVSVTEGLWLQYEIGNKSEERPLISFHSDISGFSAASPETSFGSDNQSEVSKDLVCSILSSNDTGYTSNLTKINPDIIKGTTTKLYLDAYIE